MSKHFKTVCKICEKSMGECRCMCLDKTIIFEVCDECKDLLKEKEINNEV